MGVRAAVSGWINDPNVKAIDYGWRERGGKIVENESCIRIHVIQKFKYEAVLEEAIEVGVTNKRIPESIAGIPVDVPQRDYLLQWGWSRRQRLANERAERKATLLGGISIANARLRGYGTLGGLVIDRKTGTKMILSNWHVLAGYWDVQPGWPIYQPARGDGGSKYDTVAKFSRHAMDSDLDAAVAEFTSNRQFINDQLGLEPVRGVGWAQLGMDVVKSGRRTGVTYGRVIGVEGLTKMSYRGINRVIRNVITIEPPQGLEVSAGGDSGSFWLDRNRMEVVGLHFAGSNYPESALAIDMHPILDELDVDIA
jgi:endonuclease G